MSIVMPHFREIHDISVPLSEETPVWPGDPPFRMAGVTRIDQEGGYNLSELHLGTHTGTHIDAPYHVFEGGDTVDRFSLETLCGPAWVLEVDADEQIRGEAVVDAWEAAYNRENNGDFDRKTPMTRVLLKTRGSRRWASLRNRDMPITETFLSEGFSGLTEGAAAFLAAFGIRLVGIDGPSIDARPGALAAHRRLLGAGVAVVECLDLSRVTSGVWFLCCLPLPVTGADGAPARAILARP